MGLRNFSGKTHTLPMNFLWDYGLLFLGNVPARVDKGTTKVKDSLIPKNKLKTHLDGQIESILKFSYDALCDDKKYLFLHIACFFNDGRLEKIEEHLSKRFIDVRQGLHDLAEKSLISIYLDELLLQLGREIVRKQYAHELRKRQFLVDARDICEVLNDDAVGSKSVLGIEFNLSGHNKLNISERAFERVSNLQFLRLFGDHVHPDRLYLPQCLNYQLPKLRILEWFEFPMTCLPSNFSPKFLVELNMCDSELGKLWEE